MGKRKNNRGAHLAKMNVDRAAGKLPAPASDQESDEDDEEVAEEEHGDASSSESDMDLVEGSTSRSVLWVDATPKHRLAALSGRSHRQI